MSEKSSKLVYLYILHSDEFEFEISSPSQLCWYVVNTETGESFKDENMSNYNFPNHSSCCFLNSKIYVIGGQHSYFHYEPLSLHPPLNQVLIFDTNPKDDTENYWKIGKPMNGSRAFSVLVPLPQLGNKGRIYVFGCDGFGYGDVVLPESQATPPWAEYYDAESDKWIQLLDPPADFLNKSHRRMITGSAVYGKHKIILWSERCFSIFDALKQQWHPYIVEAPLERIYKLGANCIYNTKVIVYHDILLWFFGSDILAYDLVENKPFENSVFSFQDNKDSSTSLTGPNFGLWKNFFRSPFLVVSGKDQLCLIWYNSHKAKRRDDGSFQESFAIHNIKFQIRKSSSGGIDLKPLQQSPSSECVDGFLIMFAGTALRFIFCGQWQDDEENFDFDGSGPQSSSLSDVLEKLPRAMCDLNYGIYFDYKWDKVTIMWTGLELKEEESLDTFLKKQGLEKYIKIFQEEDITLSNLRTLQRKDFEDLDIPVSSSRKLRLALQDGGYGVIGSDDL